MKFCRLASFSLCLLVFSFSLLLDGARAEQPPLTLRIGYFPNITHSQALIGFSRGEFQKGLGSAAKVKAVQFNAGPAAIEALFAGEIDIAYVGPNPAINGFIHSHGEALKVVSGATSGGAAFVVRPDSGIEKPEDLKGKHFATPQLGNTQDVALRVYLQKHGFGLKETDGDIEITPMQNAQILNLFRQKEIDGAWVPEPWASMLITEAGGKLFLDERDLWPQGNFSTAVLIARSDFLEAHRDLVKNIVSTHLEITQWELAHQNEALSILDSEIEKLTRQKLSPTVLNQAWQRLRPTWDPGAVSLQEAARAAHMLGFLREKPDLTALIDFSILREVLKEKSLPMSGIDNDTEKVLQ